MKRSDLGVLFALAIAVPAAIVYADANQGKWCPLDPGPGDMRSTQMVDTAGQYDGPHDGIQAERLGSGDGHVGPGDDEMSPFAGHMSAPSAGNVTARREKNGDFECPGWEKGNGKGTDDSTSAGDRDTGGKREKE